MEHKIFYYCYDHQRPTGGQKLTYQHVDILNENGLRAWIVHKKQGFRLNWFQNQTPVLTMSELARHYDPKTDIFVLPEDLGIQINRFPGKKVIYNKNIYHGFSCYPHQRGLSYPYLRKDVLAAFTVSEHNQAQLAYAYPDLEVIHVVEGISLDLFRHREWAVKKPRIAVLERKATPQWKSLFHILESRGRAGLSPVRDFEWIVLGSQTASEIADIFSHALLFVFLNVEEGLPLMVLEAAASGCITVGYGCGPLQECLPARCRFQHGNLRAVAEFIEEVMHAYPDHLMQFDDIFEESRQCSLAHARQVEVESVLAAWRRVLAKMQLLSADRPSPEGRTVSA